MKILLVDDHPLIHVAVRHVLSSLEFSVEILTASRCDAGMDIAAVHEDLDLALLDLNLPGLSGIAGLKAWRQKFPAVPVVVLSVADDRATVLAAMKAGAAGFIPKSSSNEVMLSALKLVLAGGKYLPIEAVRGPTHTEARSRGGRRLAQSEQRHDPAALERLGLSQRQVDVLRLLARGEPTKVICRELGLAERTVKGHISVLFRVLGVESRTQAALAAAAFGIAPGLPKESPKEKRS